MFVHHGCLWLGGPIPITYILIHKIMHLSYEGLNPAKEFVKKMREKDLAERMNKYYKFVKKSQGYSILSITDPVVQLAS